METRPIKQIISILVILAMLAPLPAQAGYLRLPSQSDQGSIGWYGEALETGGPDDPTVPPENDSGPVGPAPTEGAELPVDPETAGAVPLWGALGELGSREDGTQVVPDIEAYWQAEQLRSVGQLQVQLAEPVTGDVYLRLVDPTGQTVGYGDTQRLSGGSEFRSHLYTPGALAAGEYTIEVCCNGTQLADATVYTAWWTELVAGKLPVTADTLVLGMDAYNPDGRPPLAGDGSVYVRLTVIGVADPNQLTVELRDVETLAATAVSSAVLGKTASGAGEFIYCLQMESGLALERDVLYQVHILSTAGDLLMPELSFGLPSEYAQIYTAIVLDGASGQILAKLSCVPEGEYRVDLVQQDSQWNELSRRSLQVSYDGSGVLELQFMDADSPAYLHGDYTLQIWDDPGADWALASYPLAITYDGDMLGDSYTAAALLAVDSGTIRAEQPVDLSARLANVSASAEITAELVTVDQAGRVTAALTEPVPLLAIPAYDPDGYRFVNLYTVSGELSVPALLPGTDYRWRITCWNLNGDERQLISAEPLPIGASCRLTPQGLLTVRSEGQFEPSAARYYLSSTAEEIDIQLLDIAGLDELERIAVLLRDSQDTLVGSLSEPLSQETDQLTGQITINRSLVSGNYELVVRYGDDEVDCVNLTIVDTASVGSCSVQTYGDVRPLPAGHSFDVTLGHPMALEEELLQLTLLAPDGAEIQPIVTTSRTSEQLVLHCQTSDPLSGVYLLSLQYDGAPLPLGQPGYHQPWETEPLLPLAVTFQSQPWVSDAQVADGEYHFLGGNFDGSQDYQLLLYREADPLEQAQVGLQVSSRQRLVLGADDLPERVKGDYQATVLENGAPLPVTRPLRVILQPSEQPVIQPVVTINHGAAFTFQPEVEINLSFGSFTMMRYAASTSELTGLPYRPVTTSFPYTLSEGFGEKIVYLQFRDAAGRETEKTASIRYASEHLAAPIGYGASSGSLCSGLPLTVWVRYDAAVLVTVKFLDAGGELIDGLTQTVARTGVEYGTSTYSRRLIVNADYQRVQTMVIALEDPLTHAKWSGELPMVYEPRIFLTRPQTMFEKIYHSTAYLCRQSQVNLRVTGSPGMAGEAVLTYRPIGATESTTTNCQLTEGTAGSYAGELTLPADAAQVIQVEYRLSSPISAQSESAIDSVNLEVAGAAQFVGLPNGDEAFAEAYLTLCCVSSWGFYQQRPAGDIMFANLPPGRYEYYLSGVRSYTSGALTVRAGDLEQVSLAETPLPARLSLTTESAATGDVYYTITDRQGNSWHDYSQFGGTTSEQLSDLMIGDTVDYQIELATSCIERYYTPPAGRIVIGQALESVAVQPVPIAKIEISGRVVDQAYASAGKVKPVAGAVVYLTQSLANGNATVYNNQSTVTDADGVFHLSAFPGTAGELQVSKTNYAAVRQSIAAQSANHSLAADLEMRYLATGYLTLQFQVAAASRPEAELEYLPADLSQARIAAVTKLDGSPVWGSYSAITGQFSFNANHGLQEGDQLRVRVTAESGLQLDQAEIVIQLDPHLSGTAVARAIAPGEISLAASGADGELVHSLIFNASGVRVASSSGFDCLSTRQARLMPGDYTVILFSGNDLARMSRITQLTQLQTLGMREGIEYLRRDVTVTQGRIYELVDLIVPTVTDEAFGYLAGEGTGIMLQAGDLVEEGKARAQVTVRYQLPERLLAAGYAVREIRFQASTGHIVGGHFYLNGAECLSGSSSFWRTIGTEEGRRPGVLRLELELDQESQVQIAATVSVSLPSGGLIVETLDSVTFDLPNITIVAPEETLPSRAGELPVSGVGYRGHLVEISDNGQLVGKAIADERGRWQATINLTNPLLPDRHQLSASMIVDGETLVANALTSIVADDAVRLEDVVIWQPHHFQMSLDIWDDTEPQIATIAPAGTVYARFKLVSDGQPLPPEDVDYAGLVNELYSQTSMFEAEYQSDGEYAGYWYVDDAVLRYPGALSIIYSLKPQSDPAKEAWAISQMTGIPLIDPAAIPEQPQVDPNTLPSFVQAAFQASDDPAALIVLDDDECPYLDGSDGGNISATLDLGAGRRLTVTGTLSELPTAALPAGVTRVDTAAGPYWTSAPTVETDEAAGTIRVVKRVYFSPELWNALNPPQRSRQTMLAARGYGAADMQDNLQVAEYTSLATGAAGDLYELSKGAGTLGKLGTGLQAFGGVSLVGSALLGRMGLDPAELKAAASRIEDSRERERLMGEIREYVAATSKSHYINTFMGTVSYAASFVGPVGKGLSYVVTTGGMAYSNAIGSEYESWGNSIVSMIRSALERQERNQQKLGKKKKLNDPKWKIDPSGYVFEATESERIAGVTATVLLKDGAGFRVWSEAEEWDETNPQQTDELGKYGWDVPAGEWKVRFESAGYQTYETKEMSVPPLHDQVNIGLLATAAPELVELTLYPDALEVGFDKYMLPAAVSDGIVITDADGLIVPVEQVILLDAVSNSGYNGESDYSDLVIAADQFAKRFRIVPDTAAGGFARYADDGTTATTYQVRLLPSIVSYASVPLAAAIERELAVSERESTAITVQAQLKSKVYGEPDPALTYEIVAGVLSDGDVLSGGLERVAGESVGSYQINLGTLSGGDRYQINYLPADLLISKRATAITADNQSKYVGAGDPTFTYRVTAGSLLAGDGLTGQLVRQAGEASGTYEIRQGTLSAGSNYQLSFQPGVLTIRPLPTTPPSEPGEPDSSGETGTPPTGPDPGTTLTPEDGVDMTLSGTAVVGAGGATVALNYAPPADLVEQIATAREQGADSLNLRLGSATDNDVWVPRNLTIPNEALTAAAAGETAFSLTISTAAGSLTLPPTLVELLAAQGQPLVLTIHRTEAAAVGNLPVGASMLNQPLAVETELSGRTLVTIPLGLQLPDDATERAAFLHSLSVWAAHSSGERDLIHDLQLELDETVSPAVLRSIRFGVDEFSAFAVVKFASAPLLTTVGTPGYSIAGVRGELPACYYQGSDTMMPLRMLESFGVDFEWNADSKTVTISYRGRLIKLQVGTTTAEIDGTMQSIIGASGQPMAPRIVSGRVVLPLRFVAEVLGFRVHWSPTHLITITPN